MSATVPAARPARPPTPLLVLGGLVLAGAVATVAIGPATVGAFLYRPPPLLFGQLLLGLINGAFYALLSLGLAVIFGMLNIINFAHGALFMLGAFVAWMMLTPNTWLGMISPGLAVPDWLSLGLLAGAHDRAAHRRRVRPGAGKDRHQPAVQARPPLWPAADVRAGADHRGAGPQRLRQLRHALPHPAAAAGRRRTSASCSCPTTAAGWWSPPPPCAW